MWGVVGRPGPAELRAACGRAGAGLGSDKGESGLCLCFHAGPGDYSGAQQCVLCVCVCVCVYVCLVLYACMSVCICVSVLWGTGEPVQRQHFRLSPRRKKMVRTRPGPCWALVLLIPLLNAPFPEVMGESSPAPSTIQPPLSSRVLEPEQLGLRFPKQRQGREG